jgi:hypothetical protein
MPLHYVDPNKKRGSMYPEKGSRHEDESIDGHGRRCSGSLGRWCHVDRTIGLG